jgi:hypothetical protein
VTPTPGHDGAGIRLVATDLDGTLLTPEGIVSRRTVDAVAAARQAGIHVVPATGRPPQSVWDLAAAAGLGPWGVCSNGAVLVDLERSEVTATDAFSAEEMGEIVEVVRKILPAARLAIDNLSCFTYETGFFESVVDWGDIDIATVADIAGALDDGAIKLIIRQSGCSAPELIALVGDALAERVALTTSGLDWVDVGLPLVSKGSRLATVCEQLGVAATEVIAIGDNYNDLPMLAWAGTAMAVANAVPAVLAVADTVLASNADHGVAALLESLVAEPV